jgi:hypothetical protein
MPTNSNVLSSLELKEKAPPTSIHFNGESDKEDGNLEKS